MAIRSFTRLFDAPHVFRGAVLLVFSKGSQRTVSRVGITIKGRLPSLWRSRIKRAVREAFRTDTNLSGARDDNFVVRISSAVDWKFFEKLERDRKLWSKSLLR